MDRVIKFRGFSVLFNKWIYGVGLKYDRKGKPQIYVDTGWYEVYEGSEGQFIGLPDCNGDEIYEKDILQDESNQKYIVEYDDERCMFLLEWATNEDRYHEFNPGIQLKVIGNTFEHQHLLEGVK